MTANAFAQRSSKLGERFCLLRADLETRLKETACRLVFDTITPEELAGIIKRIDSLEIDPQGAVHALLSERDFGRLK